MTIQTLFDRMSVYDNQLDLISGGDDVTRGLLIVNLVQDWYELVAAAEPDFGQTHEALTTTANQEYTTWPTDLMRLDSLWRTDSSGVPVLEMEDIDRVGGHFPPLPWPLNALVVSSGSVNVGAPDTFYTRGRGGQTADFGPLIYWSPKPDAVYNIRGYGFWAATDYTAAANTFLYPDSVALAVAPFAAQIFRIGLDRDLTATQAAAEAAFRRVIKGMNRQVRVRAQSRQYDEYHDT